MTSATPTDTWFDRATRRPLPWLCAFVAILALQLSPTWDPGRDDLGYLSMAHSFAHTGQLLRLGNPLLHYAPGYPILISPFFLLSEKPFLLLSLFNLASAALLVFGVHTWVRRDHPRAALAVAGLTVLGAGFMLVFRKTIPETFFMALLVWTALAFRRLLDATTPRDIVRWTLVAAAMLFLTAAVRQVGVFLVLGYGVTALFAVVRRRFGITRLLITCFAAGLPPAILLLALIRHDERALAVARDQGAEGLEMSTYFEQFQDTSTTLAGRLAEGYRLRSQEVGRLTLPGFFGSYNKSGHARWQRDWFEFPIILYLPYAAAVAIFGWWPLARRGDDPLVWTALFYVLMFIAWPFDQGTRFMVPMLPVLWLAICDAILRRPAAARHAATIFVALLIAHLGQAVAFWARDARVRARESQNWPPLSDFVGEIGHNPGATATLGLTQDARLILMYQTDRYAADATPPARVPPKAQWLVSSNDNKYEIPADFEIIKRDSKLTLSKRIQN